MRERSIIQGVVLEVLAPVHQVFPCLMVRGVRRFGGGVVLGKSDRVYFEVDRLYILGPTVSILVAPTSTTVAPTSIRVAPTLSCSEWTLFCGL